ncbi:membrane protein [Pullulanibacillus camelliae]|uniref:Membrane protein n=1 Tax=Pullulanibacillus camelliae TaxID=1707096 RepID=A0A8J2YFH1_9BACL|nr:SLC13 family permease [Pullulanibacillus camelliae]GGE42206.1 membrane protein [Pullulanibacillus camelliae]
MGSLSVVSLLAVLVAVVVGYFRRTNVGIITIGLALVLAEIYHIDSKEIIAGFSSSLFVSMTGVIYLFSIVRQNNTLHLIEAKILSLVKHRVWIIPIVMYLLGFVLTAIGPGAIPNLAIIPLVGASLAVATGFEPLMLSLIGIAGIWGGRMVPITPEGILVKGLLTKQGLAPDMTPIFLGLLITSVVMAILPYLYYKGWKPKPVSKTLETEVVKFNWHQIMTLIGILVMVVCATVFQMNVGLVAFLIGAILVAFGAADEKESIKSIPWNVLLLILGVGMLMEIVVSSGGIDLLSKGLLSVMGPHTSTAFMELAAGIMSLFSSAIGVVFPTLIPTASHIASSFHGAVSPYALTTAVVVGSTITGLSPISEAGALIIAATSANADKDDSDKKDINKMFIQLIAWALVALIVAFLLAILGVYKLV